MAAEHLDAVFEPYHQAQAHQASIGLGLAFCKMAIEAHQGRIGVSSRPGQGSTCWFTLPLKGAQGGVRPLSEELAQSSGAVIKLSMQDKLYLQPYLSQIKEYKIYHFTKIKSILQEIEVNDQPQLALWKDTLKQAIATANQPQYECLINVD